MATKKQQTVGERIALARKAKRWSQTDLAQAVGVKSQSVNQWERRNIGPNKASLESVALALNVTLSWLLTGQKSNATDVNQTADVRVQGGRYLPMRTEAELLGEALPRDNGALYPTHFPGGPQSYFVELPDDSCAPESPRGTRWAIDPDLTPTPGSKVVANSGGRLVFGELVIEMLASGAVTIVRPIDRRWPDARSDVTSLTILGTRTERVLRG